MISSQAHVPRATPLLRFFGRGLAAIGALLVLVTVTPLVTWWARALAGPWDDPPGEILIVLAGDQIDDDIIGESSYWRSVYAVRFWRSNQFRQIVISGSNAAATMGRFLVSQGVPAAAITIEGRSTSTRENAVNTAEVLRGFSGRKVLLTSDYHMYRAHRAFLKAGLAVSPRPFPDAGKRVNIYRSRWGLFCELAAETGKILYYRARGWI